MDTALRSYIDGTLAYHQSSYNFMRQFSGNLSDLEIRVNQNSLYLDNQKVSAFASTSQALIESEKKPYFTWKNLAIIIGSFVLSFLAARNFYPQQSDELDKNVIFLAIAINAGADLSTLSQKTAGPSIAAKMQEYLNKLPPGTTDFTVSDPIPPLLAKTFTLFENDVLRRKKVTILLAFTGAIVCTAFTVFMRIRAHDNLLAKLKAQHEEIMKAPA